MNFHLMMVHFPIALLTLYAFLEIISIKRLQALPYWWYIKALLVIAGSLSTFVTRQTGEMIEHEFDFVRNVVEVHSRWANITTGTFAVLALSYLIGWIDRAYPLLGARLGKAAGAWAVAIKIEKIVLHRYVSLALALFGLAAVTITGALGGSISAGPDIDPVVKIVYRIFVGEPQQF